MKNDKYDKGTKEYLAYERKVIKETELKYLVAKLEGAVHVDLGLFEAVYKNPYAAKKIAEWIMSRNNGKIEYSTDDFKEVIGILNMRAVHKS